MFSFGTVYILIYIACFLYCVTFTLGPVRHHPLARASHLGSDSRRPRRLASAVDHCARSQHRSAATARHVWALHHARGLGYVTVTRENPFIGHQTNFKNGTCHVPNAVRVTKTNSLLSSVFLSPRSTHVLNTAVSNEFPICPPCLLAPTASAGGSNQFDAKHAALDGSLDVQHEFRLMALTGDGAFVAGGLQVRA
jgi:hypothetical protein